MKASVRTEHVEKMSLSHMQIRIGFFSFPLNNTENIFHMSVFFIEISVCSLCATDRADQVPLTTVITLLLLTLLPH